MRAIVQRHTTTPTLTGEARTLTGYVTRIAVGMGAGLADSGHIETLRGNDVVAVPLDEAERITTFVLHKYQRFGLADAPQRFVAHARTLS